MFSGTYNHTVDAKGRLVLPSRFRGSLGQLLYLTRGINRCLWLFPDEGWRAVVEMLGADSMTNPDTLALQRFFVGSAAECTPDDMGRIPLPALLRDYAGIDRETVVVGVGPRVEIWSRERWDAYSAQDLSDERILEMAQRASL